MSSIGNIGIQGSLKETKNYFRMLNCLLEFELDYGHALTLGTDNRTPFCRVVVYSLFQNAAGP